MSETGLRKAFRAACQDLGAISALLGYPEYPGIDALLRQITTLIAAAAPTDQRMSDAARDVITVWSDGTWKCWRAGDAAYAADDPDWLLNIPIDAARKAVAEHAGGSNAN